MFRVFLDHVLEGVHSVLLFADALLGMVSTCADVLLMNLSVLALLIFLALTCI